MTFPLNRRTLFQSSVAAGAATYMSAYASKAQAASEAPAKKLKAGATILFQGDSITDVGRSRAHQQANNTAGLGNGYPLLIASELLCEHAALELKIHNRGISGNKVPDLAKRWQADCLDIQPDVLSILIGVNDIWHKLNGRYDGTVEVYAQGYRHLIETTLAALPEVRIIVCEPFVLRTGAVSEKWFPEFDQRREAALLVAKDFDLTVVPFQSMFDRALDQAPAKYWAGDGVHPTLAGHALMAKTWREVVGI